MRFMTGQPRFDFEAERVRFAGIPEFRELQGQVPDAIEMVSSTEGEKGLTGQALVDYWDTIGKDKGGFFDDIRENGCSSCGSHTPGCCDGCS